ncbi:uncharacterized protein LOC126908091 [Daktulosphaira vitifoliae]|uniref:uncharacterized protein LOC126908091 n=1 Tax=Daktulosphaira vitifoliae TaxID=58002 RepID=UPI0021AAF3B3|nr:uncharacterized protein LOC126908091 [Daktulosphaira vitifoliae]
MEFYSIILMSIGISVLKIDEGVNCICNYVNNYPDNYRNYIKTVIDYISSHIELNEILNLKLKEDSNTTFSVEEVFISHRKYTKFKTNYFYTINVLNFKYTEILKNFLDYIDIILQKCKQFHERNLEENFICCVTSLVEEVKNSKTMFENLHNAMTFFSYIDVRFVFQGSIMPNVIIDEIDFFQKYVLQKISENSHLDLNRHFDLNCLPNFQDSEMNFKNLNEFHTVASKIVNNLYQNSNIIIDTSIKSNSTTIDMNEDDSYLVYLTCSKLKSFYNKNIEIWYKNLGFEQFLNPKTPQLLPPIDPNININMGIKAFNILRQESGWKTMEHINIVYNGKLFSVDCIMKDPINIMNFQIKKEHVIQLLRCRYTEIIKNYHVLLSSILSLCSTKVNGFSYNCLIKLFDSFNKSKIMFEGLHTALITLQKSSLWNYTFLSHSNLQKILKWIEDFLSLLNNNEFSQDNFVGQNGILITEILDKNLKNFLNVLKQSNMELRIDLKNMTFRCNMREPYYKKSISIKYFKYLASKMRSAYYEQSIQIYSYACNYFDEFCKNIYKSCYENLGFRKVYSLNNSSDKILIVH